MTATPLEPHIAFAELSQIKLSDTDLPAVLGRVAELARQTLPGAADVSVTLINAGQATTAAFCGVAGEQDAAPGEVERDAARGVAGHGRRDGAAAGGELITVADFTVDPHRRRDRGW